MCDFVSHIEYERKNYFLTNADLETKEGRALEQKMRDDGTFERDIPGHGAVRAYYPELKRKGVDKECTDFSTPDNFPKEIAKALKHGDMSRIGIALDILNKDGVREYDKIDATALVEYKKIKASARVEYEKITRPARAKYEKIQASAYTEYEKIEIPAYAEYQKIEIPAYAEYKKIKASARVEYEKITRPARAKYEKIKILTYFKIVKQKKYRKPAWK